MADALRVFISWSGEASCQAARSIKSWLADMFDGVESFMSDVDIDAGSRGLKDIEEALKGTTFGIIVVTRENQHRPWVTFEAGAISKTVDTAKENRVAPILIDLSSTELSGPLTQFQYQEATQEGLRRVARSIGRAAGALDDSVMRRFNSFWPQLERDLIAARKESPVDDASPTRSLEDMVAEVLEHVRELTRRGDQDEVRKLLGELGELRAANLWQHRRAGQRGDDFVHRVLSSSVEEEEERIAIAVGRMLHSLQSSSYNYSVEPNARRVLLTLFNDDLSGMQRRRMREVSEKLWERYGYKLVVETATDGDETPPGGDEPS
jgi:hypothetical protein